ncbi:hypothetical protein C8R46DRAFT_1099536 [Mycena filopes]|nr:hypothetical protein C8R46DRAFT_1099536 [Mycena filopes]
MSAHKVPNELWLQVFSNLPQETLKDISLTYRLFSWITRPLIFTHLDFHPYCIGANANLLLPAQEHVDAAMERLNFWLSDEIGPWVRSCSITPWRPQGPVRSKWTWDSSPTSTPHVLLDVLFGHLAQLVGLQRLEAQGVYFTQTAITNLGLLSALTTLRVERFIVPGSEDIFDVTPRSLAISSFSIQTNVTLEDGLAHWITLLRPDSLRQLSVHCNLRLFGQELDVVPIFPLVHTLAMTLNFAAMSHNLAVLAKFPNVESLSLSGWGELSDCSHDAALLPALKTYVGPPAPLSLFLPRPNLTRLEIHYCSPDLLMMHLPAHSALNITSLDAEFDRLSNTTLDALLARFPHLAELCLRVTAQIEATEADEVDTSIATTFFDALPTIPSLPACLEHLAICWRFEFEFDYDDRESMPGGGAPPAFPALREALHMRCPALQSLWLDGHYFVFSWRGGVEVFAEDEDKAREMRKGFEAF